MKRFDLVLTAIVLLCAIAITYIMQDMAPKDAAILPSVFGR